MILSFLYVHICLRYVLYASGFTVFVLSVFFVDSMSFLMEYEYFYLLNGGFNCYIYYNNCYFFTWFCYHLMSSNLTSLLFPSMHWTNGVFPGVLKLHILLLVWWYCIFIYLFLFSQADIYAFRQGFSSHLSHLLFLKQLFALKRFILIEKLKILCKEYLHILHLDLRVVNILSHLCSYPYHFLSITTVLYAMNVNRPFSKEPCFILVGSGT